MGSILYLQVRIVVPMVRIVQAFTTPFWLLNFKFLLERAGNQDVMLEKVRSTPAPKAEKLETVIEFGMAVQYLCDHLQAVGQQSHL